MTKGIHIDNKIHKKLKREAADRDMTIRDLVEEKLG